MAAPSFVKASTGFTDGAGAWSYTTAESFTDGNLHIGQIFIDGTTGTGSMSSATGIKNLAGRSNNFDYISTFEQRYPVGSGPDANQSLIIGRAMGGTVTIAGSRADSDDLYIRFYEFSNVSTDTTLATVIENSTAGSTANTAGTDGTITDAGVTTLGPDRLALQFIGISDDNALAAHADCFVLIDAHA